MMQRRILVVTGLFVLFSVFFLTGGAQAIEYKVKKGDSLYTISKKLGVSIEEIKSANQLSDKKLKPGQVLTIDKPDGKDASASADRGKSKNRTATASPARSKPKSDSATVYKVKKGDTLATISKKTGVSQKQILALNSVSPKTLRVGRTLVLSKAPRSSSPIAQTEEELLEDEEDDEDASTAEPGSEIACEKQTEELMGMWGSPEERKLLIKVATGFLGAPYRLGGATVKGIDCSAFVRKMYEFFDIALPRTAREQSNVGMRVNRNELVEGDLVFFRTKKPIGHVGIYIGNNEFVHASYKNKAVRIDNLDQPYFQKRFQRAVRVKGLEGKGGT